METLSLAADIVLHGAHRFLTATPIATFEHAVVIITAIFAAINQFRVPELRDAMRPSRKKRNAADAAIDALESKRDTID